MVGHENIELNVVKENKKNIFVYALLNTSAQ